VAFGVRVAVAVARGVRVAVSVAVADGVGVTFRGSACLRSARLARRSAWASLLLGPVSGAGRTTM
jgi:hypothetical protein